MFFKRKKSLQQRFPAERISALTTLIGFGAPSAAKDAGLEGEAFYDSRFFAGYLIGYPGYVDDIDAKLGAGIRAMLFAAIHGEARATKSTKR